MALTNLSSAKKQAGISLADTSRDDQIRAFIDGLSDFVKRYLGRDIESQTYTEYHSGDGSVELLLRQWPVSAVSRVCIDFGGYYGDAPSAFPAANDLAAGVDYALASGLRSKGSNGILRRIGGTWSRMPSKSLGTLQPLPSVAQGNILVTYIAGYSPIPPALVMAVNSLVIKGVNDAQLGGPVQSATYEDASITYCSSEEVRKTIASATSSLGLFKSIVI